MDLFSISSIIVFLASISFALFLYHDNKKSTLNRAWFAVSCAIALWSLSLFGVTSSSSEAGALMWQYLLDISGIFVPVLLVRFILIFLKRQNTSLILFMWAAGIGLSALSVTSYFKIGVVKTATVGFYWIQPGTLYFLFPLFFVTSSILVGWYLLRDFRLTDNEIFKGQIKYQLVAAVFGLSGGITNFFPQLFDIYPFGNYFIILYLFFMSFAIFRYRLLPTNLIATQFLAGALVLVLLFDLLRSSELGEWILRLAIFVVTLGLSIVLVRSMQKEIEIKLSLQDLTQQLQKANARLKELDQQKSEFLSIATHQLRGPLAGIRGHLSLILDGSYGKVTKRTQEVIERIFRSSGILVQTVNDFLNVSRIEQGRMQYDREDFAVNKLVGDIVEELEPVAKARNLKLTLEDTCTGGACTVHADKAKLSHIFLNLIDNAIKYTEKGWVKVTLAHEGKVVRFAVTDSGVGIAPDEIGALFEKFVRTKGASSVNVNGTGLGLYVARQMVEAHNGKIWAESDGKGKGSSFIVELPTK